MSFSDFRELNDEELVHTELQLERDLIAASFRLRTGQLEDTASIAVMRKNIARIRTLERQRELAEGNQRNALRTRYRATFAPSTPDATTAEAAGGFLKGIVDKIGSKD